MERGNLFAAPARGQGETFDSLLQAGGLRIERILSFDHAQPAGEWYEQAEAEWVVLLEGRAGLRFEGEAPIELGPGDYLPSRPTAAIGWSGPPRASAPCGWRCTMPVKCRHDPGAGT